MSTSRASGPNRAGYTIVELLIAIGIIAALVALLLPAIASARRAARSTACLATLQQWGNAFQMYLSANRGRSFSHPVASGPRTNVPLWWEHLEPYHPEVEQTLLCPEATEPANVEPANAFQAWGPMHLWPEPGRTRMSYVGSYGINGWIYQTYYDSDGGPGPRVRVAGSIRLPSNRADWIPLIFDSAHFHIAPLDTGRAGFDPDAPIVYGHGWMRHAALRRHGRG